MKIFTLTLELSLSVHSFCFSTIRGRMTPSHKPPFQREARALYHHHYYYHHFYWYYEHYSDYYYSYSYNNNNTDFYHYYC